jgi:hypothetical protein
MDSEATWKDTSIKPINRKHSNLNMSTPIEEADRFLLKNGLDKIDFNETSYAWGFRENEPIIALIQSIDGGEVFQSVMSLYWASAEYIAKPWCLLLVVDDLPPPQRQMLESLSKQYNIQQIENKELLHTVQNQLKRLTEILIEYIPEDSENPIKALGESMKGWRTEKPATEFNYGLNIEVGNLDLYRENDQLVPSRKTIPLTAASDETRIEGILPRLISNQNGLHFDTEHRNLPMVFRLTVGEKSELVMRFEADKSNIIEATSFWSLHQSFIHTNKLAFIEPNTGDILFNCVRVTG